MRQPEVLFAQQCTILLSVSHIPESQPSSLLYRERVIPRISSFVVATTLVAMIAIAYGAAIDVRVGILIMAIVGIGLVLLMYFNAPLIEVRQNLDATLIRVGNAHIRQTAGQSNEWVNPRILSAEELVAARRGQLDATAYLDVRSGMRAIAIDLVNSDDPHGMWVISTRKPEALVSVLDNP